MNPSSEIVGVYRDASSKVHSFLMSGERSFSIDYRAPSVRATQAFGTDPHGDVVGAYGDAVGIMHGFLRTQTRQHGK